MPLPYGILILSYNHPDLTSQTVDSVLKLNTKKNGIYLVHNGSEIKHILQLQNKFPLINHLILSKNLGYSGGANFGLSEAFKTENEILFLTNDTEALQLPDSFPDNLDFFSIIIFKRNTEHLDSLIGTIDLKKGQLRHLRSANELPGCFSFVKTYIPGTAFGMTKKAFEKLGGFDETLHTYWEDVEISLRAHLTTDLRLGFSDIFKVKHKIGKTCHKHRFYTLYLFQRNRKRIMLKYGHSKFHFLKRYTTDMLFLLIKILSSKDRWIHFQLWWQAIYDT